MLLGKMPDASPKAQDQAALQDEIARRGPTTKREFVGLQDMLVRTRKVHMDIRSPEDEPPAKMPSEMIEAETDPEKEDATV